MQVPTSLVTPSFFSSSLYVALGGGLGAWLRFLTGRAAVQLLGPVRAAAFPWATLACNVLGSLAMGLLAGWLVRHVQGGHNLRLLLGVGLLGGFTTFSAFSLEFVLMVERGQTALALGYVAVSLIGGIGGLALGLAMMRGAL
jgi:CrcB protein